MAVDKNNCLAIVNFNSYTNNTTNKSQKNCVQYTLDKIENTKQHFTK